MVRLLVLLLAVCLGAAVAGVVVPGLFSLTLVAMGGLLLIGAAGVGTHVARTQEPDAPVQPRTELRLVTSASPRHDRADGRGDTGARQAA